MRNLIIFLLTATSMFAQKYTLELVLPIKTYHFNRLEVYRYDDFEGGNLGGILSLTKKGKKLDNIFSTGVFKNSYGKPSFMASYGKSKAFKKNTVGLQVGFATNYTEAYYTSSKNRKQGSLKFNDKMAKNLSLFYNNKSLPFGSIFYKRMISDTFRVILNVNPVYINTAIVIKIK